MIFVRLTTINPAWRSACFVYPNSMPSYAAFIGHQPHISLAELAAAVPGYRLKGVAAGTAALFESSTELPPSFLHVLGGTVVLARQVDAKNPATADLPDLLAKELEGLKGKVTFSLRTAGLQAPEIKSLYRDCKDALRKRGRSSRYVGNERQPAAAVLLRDSGILDASEGVEMCVVKDGDRLWIGRTLMAQDVDAYTKRDMEKPVRDTTVGLLPPKLAQILLNFGVWLANGPSVPAQDDGKKKAKTKEPAAPFIVFDKSEKAVTGCQKNIEWVRKEYHVLKTEKPSKVWKQDALKPFMLTEKDPRPAVIVTETTLGPSLKSRPTARDVQSLRSEVEKIEEGFLKNVAATLPGVPVACTWPVWYSTKEPTGLEKIWTKLAAIGFEPVLPPDVQSTSREHPSLLYRRPDQFVGREIVLLKPIKR
jgi:hypothetical protein